MSNSTIQFVAYIVAPAAATKPGMLFHQQTDAIQKQRIEQYLAKTPGSVLLKTFVEQADFQRRNKWPQLTAAVTYCLENSANLIIGELKNLTRNDAFSEQILRLIGHVRERSDSRFEAFKGEFYCCDQPLVNAEHFVVLVEHAKEQKKLHGELIRAGLNRTTAKSGNPNAAQVIAQVNKPKIDNAIVFALVLQPIISEYLRKGYSQRKMVAALNEEGFSAPEGGQWVLSQLQKVLERMNLNKSAMNLEKTLLEYRGRGYDDAHIADQLNKNDVPAPKDKVWTVECVQKVSERVKQIHDIIRFNEFVIELMPILEKYRLDELNEQVLLQEFEDLGVLGQTQSKES